MAIYNSRQILDPSYIVNQMKNQTQSERDTWNALASVGKDVVDWYKENKLKKEWKDTTDELLNNTEFKDDPTYKALVYQANKNRDISPVTNYVNTVRQQKETAKIAGMNAEQEKLKGVYDAQTNFDLAKKAYDYAKAKGDVEGMNNALDAMDRANRQSNWYGGPSFTIQTETETETEIPVESPKAEPTPEEMAAANKERTDKIASFNTRIATIKQKQPGKKAKREDIIAFNESIDTLVKEIEASGLELGDVDKIPELLTVPVSKVEDRKKAEEIAKQQLDNYTETGVWDNAEFTTYYKIYQGAIKEKK